MRRKTRNRLADDVVADAVHEALLAEGWMVPSTDAEVAAAEEEFGGPDIALPAELPAPEALPFPGDPGPVPEFKVPPWGSAAVETTLARAAREGGAVSPEVESKMRCDRAAAEAARQAGQKDGGRA